MRKKFVSASVLLFAVLTVRLSAQFLVHPFQANETVFARNISSYPARAAVAALPDGSFAVAWHDFNYGNVYIRKFNRDGQPQSGDVRMNNNTYCVSLYDGPKLMVLDHGNILATWKSVNWSSGIRSSIISGQLYDADLKPQNVNRYCTYLYKEFDSWAVSKTGQTAAVYWQGDSLMILKSDFEGSKLGGVLTLRDAGRGSTAAAIHQSGSIAVAWRTINGWAAGINLIMFDPDGNVLQEKCGLSDETSTDLPSIPVLGYHPDGRLSVAWAASPAGIYCIAVQHFDADGQPRGGNVLLDKSMENHVWHPHISCGADGCCLIAWEKSQDLQSSIRYQMLNENGLPCSRVINVTEPHPELQSGEPCVAYSNHHIYLAWESDDSRRDDLYVSAAVDSLSGWLFKKNLDNEWLLPPFPNPFADRVTVPVYLGEQRDLSAVVYDIRGRQVASWPSEYIQEPQYDLVWDGCDSSGRTLSAGVYILLLNKGGKSISVKLVKMGR